MCLSLSKEYNGKLFEAFDSDLLVFNTTEFRNDVNYPFGDNVQVHVGDLLLQIKHEQYKRFGLFYHFRSCKIVYILPYYVERIIKMR